MSKYHLKLVVSNEVSEPDHQEESPSVGEGNGIARFLKGIFGVTLYLTWISSLLVFLAIVPMKVGVVPMDDRFSSGQIDFIALLSFLIFTVGFVTKGKHPGVTDHGF